MSATATKPVPTCPTHHRPAQHWEHGIVLCAMCIMVARRNMAVAEQLERQVIDARLHFIAQMYGENPTPRDEHLDHATPRDWCHLCRAGMS